MIIEIGRRVVIVKNEGTLGMLVADKHLECRRVYSYGTLKGIVPGHGGDVVWVEHDSDQSVGAYALTELIDDMSTARHS